MSLQARLTIWAIALSAAIIGIVSLFDLSAEIRRQFDSTHHDTELIRRFAEEFVKHSIDRDTVSATPQLAVVNDAPHLSRELAQLMTGIKPLVEVAVCDPMKRVIGDSLPSRMGQPCPDLPDWNAALHERNWFDRLRLLWIDTGNYQVQDEVFELATHAPVFYVYLVLQPAIIRGELEPVLRTDLSISGLSVLGAMLAAFIFSNIALRPLGRLGR
ncbi:MAG: hypothetical protein M3N54_04510, partial [Acidobacteriota bacterium]|nr:hypothetical protein [Acidobacteriota bacterium]